MSKDIARNVALVTYGNVILQNQDNIFNIDTLITDNCYRLDFIETPLGDLAGSTRNLAKDAYQWYKIIKEQGAKRIRLHYQPFNQLEIPDYINAAFVGGGSHWLIELQFAEESDLYLCDWVPSQYSGVDRRKIHYVRIERDIDHLDDTCPSISDSRKQLKSVLEQLVKFAGKFEHSAHWVSNFEHSLATLQEFEPFTSDEFLPAGIYSKEGHQLIQGAFASWVFGGMGSWNDVSFSGADQERYELLSKNLYSILCNAIVSGVNSYP